MLISAQKAHFFKNVPSLFSMQFFTQFFQSRQRAMPNFTKIHEDAQKACCAGCGIHTAEKDRKLPLTKLLEKLIKKFAHPSFDSTVASFPVGLCATCRRMLYKCEKCEKEGQEVKPREVWSGFILEEIKVPRMSAECSVCSCPLCKCARYNPIGIVGPKEVTHKSVINVSGGNMECEIQPKVKEKVQVACQICGQIRGPGIKHGCTRAEQRLASLDTKNSDTVCFSGATVFKSTGANCKCSPSKDKSKEGGQLQAAPGQRRGHRGIGS